MDNAAFFARYIPFTQYTGVQEAAKSARRRPGHVYVGDYAARAALLKQRVSTHNLAVQKAGLAQGLTAEEASALPGQIVLDHALAALRRSIVNRYNLRAKPRRYYK